MNLEESPVFFNNTENVGSLTRDGLLISLINYL